ncbi:MAG: hypothetical protein MPJ22_02820 [Pirellulales bacterium]|nr:hypothetical protein [Pirellulales bacterium]
MCRQSTQKCFFPEKKCLQNCSFVWAEVADTGYPNAGMAYVKPLFFQKYLPPPLPSHSLTTPCPPKNSIFPDKNRAITRFGLFGGNIPARFHRPKTQ